MKDFKWFCLVGTLEWTGGRVMELTITKHHECFPQGKWMSNTLYLKQTGASACGRCTERQSGSYSTDVGALHEEIVWGCCDLVG